MSQSPSPASPTSSTLPTLDLSLLTDEDNFQSEAAWLNELLQRSMSTMAESRDGSNSLASLDTSLAKTLSALEVATHDTSALVDRAIDDISRSVPRLTFDLQLMRENALLLRFTLDGIRKRAGSGSGFGENAEVSRVMEKLRVLDLAKARMEAARDVLREAESWSTLESEVTGLVGEQAYAKAAERLEEAARSMVVFQNTTEYEARRALMVSLQNQLEASLSSSLVSAIMSRDVKACKSFYSIFGQIQREAEFTAYYFGSRRSTLVEAWTTANLVDCPNSSQDVAATASTAESQPMKLTSFLTKFYGDLHALLAEERTYVPAIFPDPTPTLSSFVSTTLESLSPSLPQRLTAVADSYGPLCLPELIQAYRATEDFALSVDRIMAKLDPSPSTPIAAHGSSGGGSISSGSALASPGIDGASATPSKRERRLSKRMSTSRRTASRSLSFGGTTASNPAGAGVPTLADHAAVRAWETAMFEPFLDWQVEYPELERQYLASEIARATVSAGTDVMGYLVEEGLDASTSQDRSGGEKGARALWELTSSVFALMEDATSRSSALTHGYAAAGLVGVLDGQLVEFLEKRRDELNRAKLTARHARRGREFRNENDDEAALEGLEYSTEDWGTFQLGLRLLDTCRSITDRLATFENKLQSRLTILAQTVREAREDPMHYTVPGTTRGALTLLRQSALNSIDLAQLLEPLEKPRDGPPAPPRSFLLPKARYATVEFTRATQLFLHDTILAPLLAHLNEYPALPAWTTTQDQRPGAKGAFDLSIPTFSLSPTDTISRVGEGLFNLPRLFEVYADDDALAFSIETLPHVDVEALRALQLPSSITLPGTPHRPSLGHTRISESISTSPQSASTLGRRSGSLSLVSMPTPSQALSAETVISTWLSSLTLSILHHLTSVVLPTIHRLTKHGARQLVSDLDYIANVARALDVEASDELEAWRDAAALEDKPSSEDEVGMDRSIYERVAKMRGWRKISVQA